MHRLVPAMLFLLALGLALAQPVDYQIMCVENDATSLVGVVVVTEDGVRAAFEEGWDCADGTLEVQDAFGETVDGVSVDVDGDGVVTLSGDDGGVIAEAEAHELPEVAIEGMNGAQQNRAMAAQRRAAGQERAERARNGETGRPDDLPEPPGPPEKPEAPEHLPEPPEMPEVPGPTPAAHGRS